MTAALTLASASPVSGANDGQIIGKNQIKLTGDRLTPEALWAMGRIGTFAVSPDAQKIVYTVSYYSVQQNKSHTVLYLMDADGANPTLLTTTADNESEPAFTPDGQRITFLSGKSGSSQIWEMALDGTSRRQVSFCHKDVEGYKFSPDGKKVIIVHSVDFYREKIRRPAIIQRYGHHRPQLQTLGPLRDHHPPHLRGGCPRRTDG